MIEVETYHNAVEGAALDPKRAASLEDEIREHELVAQRNAALPLGLAGVIDECDKRLARLRCASVIPFPLMTDEETRVWRAFLPTTYRDEAKPKKTESVMMNPFGAWSRPLYAEDYRFDLPPLSVLELWAELKARKVFDRREVWTPEVVMPEPILVGFKSLDRYEVGPFLIARWGESLEPFETIRAKAEQAGQERAAAWRAQMAAQAAAQQAGQRVYIP